MRRRKVRMERDTGKGPLGMVYVCRENKEKVMAWDGTLRDMTLGEA